MATKPDPRELNAAQRRRGVRRTALWVAALAVAIYAGFIALGVLGR